jgi:ComF family protein
MLARALRHAVRFALPPRCPACGQVVEGDHRFCAACWAGLRFLGPPWCAGCNRPFAFDRGAGARCDVCERQPPLHAGVRAAVAYDRVSRELALRLKYGGRIGLARTMAGLMRRSAPAVDLLVPVPLHRRRLWLRGYNQAQLIADALGRSAGVPVRHALVRTRATPSLRGQSRRARDAVVRGAFAVPDPGAVAGRQLGLVDDVVASGATTDAAAAVLLEAGAAAVTVLCWARVLDGDD